MTPATALPRASLSPALVMIFAVGAGLSAASLYYNQPILKTIADDLGATPAEVGLVPMLTQLGYAVGLVAFAPLGDKLERRKVIVVKAAGLAVVLLAAGLSRSIAALAAASFAIGLLATTAQDYVPAAAQLAPAASRGRTVGTVMTGLLLGILLSRVASGALGDRFGWRTVFFVASGSIAALAAASAARLPKFEPTATDSYGALLRSMAHLIRDLEPLRRAALAQGLLSLAFSAFWSTLALALAAPPFGLGSTIAGAFGLAGAVGALAAPVAGSFADTRGPVAVVRLGASLVLGAFLAMAICPGSLVVLVIGAIVFDLGVQASLISHQTIIYGLEANARSRINAVLVSAMFVGMAIGAAIASQVFARFGWQGVMITGASAAALALAVRR